VHRDLFDVEDLKNPFTATSTPDEYELQSEEMITPSEGLALLSRVKVIEEEEEEEEKPPPPPPPPVVEQQIQTKQNVTRYNAGLDQNEMKLLLEQTAEIAATAEGKALHDRLDTVWTSLGFSVHQKLAMAVRYSTRLDDFSKFLDAVKIWESAQGTVERYNITYKEMKDFVKMERATRARANALDHFRWEMKSLEASILDIAATLKGQFDDEFVIKRRRAVDLIETRRNRMNALLYHQGFTAESPQAKS
jgi:hypothetical protein